MSSISSAVSSAASPADSAAPSTGPSCVPVRSSKVSSVASAASSAISSTLSAARSKSAPSSSLSLQAARPKVSISANKLSVSFFIGRPFLSVKTRHHDSIPRRGSRHRAVINDTRTPYVYIALLPYYRSSITVQVVTIDNQNAVCCQQDALVQGNKITPGAGKQVSDPGMHHLHLARRIPIHQL